MKLIQAKLSQLLIRIFDNHSNRLNDIVEDGNYVEKILKNAPDLKKVFFYDKGY